MLSSNLTIKTATIADAPALTALGIRTFRDTFDPHNRKEDMDKYVAEQMNQTQITNELHDTRNIFFLVYDNGALTAYAKIRDTIIPDELKDSTPLEIERIYVLAEKHGTKTGAALMQHCIDYALSNHYDVIWLGVWEHNTKAVSFYNRWGFELFGSHPFILGDDHQTDVLMKKQL
jgi:GNAT superfamily N-acetyltransferase